jgi:hypothetical protein
VGLSLEVSFIVNALRSELGSELGIELLRKCAYK